jgi:thiamine-phosphate pyrophosphorylase
MKSADLLRILDANLDRASEGLRVAEDIARFVLNDQTACDRIRRMRHRLWQSVSRIPACKGRLLQARDSRQDVGREATPRPKSRSTAEILRTNLHRVQEALRCLEETFAAFGLSPEEVSTVRFEAYDCEKELYPPLRTRDLERKLDFALYVVTDPHLSRGRDFLEVVAPAIEGGAGAIQLRAKDLKRRELLAVARELRALTAERDTTFIVNDHIDVALAVDADGVHLGQEDLPLPEARRICGPDLILGASTHSREEAIRAENESANYINVGPIFPTSTKLDSGSAVGPLLITEVKAAVQCPLTCMGGINLSNVDQVILAGADRVAVVSAVVGATDVKEAARALVSRIEEVRARRKQAESGEEKSDALVS